MSVAASSTLLGALVKALRGCRGTADGVEAPAAILWTDPAGEWASLRTRLRAELPEFLELGGYDPGSRCGPAVWLRCVVDGSVEVEGLAQGAVPVLYLPGVARQDLRAGVECAEELRPLVELMYRGAMWLQKGGHDWTVSAFVGSAEGLGLDVARDRATADALQRALREFAVAPLTALPQRRLNAADFDALLAPDSVRDFLRWLGDPVGQRRSTDAAAFAALCSQVKARFGFDPASDDVETAGERLADGRGAWAEVWTRYSESPALFVGVVDLLRRCETSVGLFRDGTRWPGADEEEERQLRAALADLEGVPQSEVCEAVQKLEREHGPRRARVWAKLGLAPLAELIAPLAELAELVKRPLGGTQPEDFARQYDERAWRADALVWQIAARAPLEVEELVHELLASLYSSWLDDSARAFQRAVEAWSLPSRSASDVVTAEEGGCILFVDGLRFDLGMVLAERFEHAGLRVRRSRRWAALPTVTATAKAAVSPAVEALDGAELPQGFEARVAATRKSVDAATLRGLIEQHDHQVLVGGASDWPGERGARGWHEFGAIDEKGHQLEFGLARHIDDELERVQRRVVELLDAGWESVRIVTDHGWLLVPECLPKVQLPKHLTASRWARVAAIAGASRVDVPTFPWFWNDAQVFATPPGAGCFNSDVRYAHGGVSLQECLTPDLLVQRASVRKAKARIASVRWQGMRCLVRVDTASDGRLDLRLARATGASVVLEPKATTVGAEIGLLLADDAHEHAELVVVLLGRDGTIIDQRKTKVGAST